MRLAAYKLPIPTRFVAKRIDADSVPYDDGSGFVGVADEPEGQEETADE